MSDNFLIKRDPVKDAWLGVDTTQDITHNPFYDLMRENFFKENPHLIPVYLFRDPQFLAYAVWVLFEFKLLPFQAVILAELWERAFPVFVGTRGLSKSTLMALCVMLKALFYPDFKCIIVGAAFRQSKLVFEYCEKFYAQGTVYRSLLDSKSGTKKAIDKLVFNINSSTITALPVGPGGEKIRGLRANCIIADEFDSHNVEVFEKVIAGFGVVSQDPAESAIREMERDKLKELGQENLMGNWKPKTNQIIISGTCGYFFGPLYHYYRRNEKIIECQGDPEVIKELFNGEPPTAFDWRDYSVIRIPHELLPKGFLDEKIIARARATMNKSVFDMEYSAVFVEDSDGFFKRSIIEGCVASEKNIDSKSWVSWCPSTFEPMQKGDPTKRYVFGIDPASERDNLAIAVLEVNDDHVKLAHVWTTNKEDYQERKAKGFTSEPGYNSFVARKVRNLMKVFPCARIAIDTQGGGYALMEALHDPKYILDDEEPLWTVIDYDKPQDSDSFAGLHIIEPISFSKYEWLYEANYGLLKDMETKKLIFPRFDSVSIDLSIIQDKQRVTAFEEFNQGKTITLYDTMEDLFMEIEDLKDELTSIVISVAGTGVNGRFRWSVPEVQIEGNKKGRGRKDRYSALLMANSVARNMYREKPQEHRFFDTLGGLIQDIPKANGRLYASGPEWFTSPSNSRF